MEPGDRERRAEEGLYPALDLAGDDGRDHTPASSKNFQAMA
jgi:hypothetical protein